MGQCMVIQAVGDTSTKRRGGEKPEVVGVEEYRNEYLDGLVGRLVLTKQLSSPLVDTALLTLIEEDPTSGREAMLRSRTSVQMLESYDRLGIIIRQPIDHPAAVAAFVPWSAVIELSPAEEPEEGPEA
jgi:hypothetical protein